MKRRRLKVLLLFEVQGGPAGPEECAKELESNPDWVTERHVYRALRDNGHEVALGPIRAQPGELLAHLERTRPDLVWNAVESLRDGRRYYEAHVAALLELARVPYTGSGPLGLALCHDKALSKKILSHHRIRTPPFLVSRRRRPLRRLTGARFPLFVKPLAEEGSVGISLQSFAEDEAHALHRAAFIHEQLGHDVIFERYIEGRELYVGLLGSVSRVKALPPRELVFTKIPEGEPRFASFHAKWDPEYQKRWGIDNVFPSNLDPRLERALARTCKRAFRVLHMRGYGRIDMRVDGDQIYVIEANPNPQIAREEDYAAAARRAGLSYPRLIETIVRLALTLELP